MGAILGNRDGGGDKEQASSKYKGVSSHLPGIWSGNSTVQKYEFFAPWPSPVVLRNEEEDSLVSSVVSC